MLFCAIQIISHSRPQSPRSFWPAAGIESSGRTRFSEHAQSIRFVFSADQISQSVREVLESRASGAGKTQSSPSGFRFCANFLAVLRFWTILSSVLRFLIHPNAPLLIIYENKHVIFSQANLPRQINKIFFYTIDIKKTNSKKNKENYVIYHNRVGRRCVLHQDTETCQVITVANNVGGVGEVYITTFFGPRASISEKPVYKNNSTNVMLWN